MTRDLQRFVDAQDGTFDGFAQALAEMKRGRKRTHWIWYVFPQIAGLGRSPAAQAYAIAGRSEAEAYLRHTVLRDRLFEITTVVRDQLRNGARIDVLMGSDIDAMKLVSSMTLFRAVAGDVGDRAMADAADAVLRHGEAQGYPACEFTAEALGSR